MELIIRCSAFVSLHWVPVEYFDQLQAVAYSSAADVWAYGTTLWEIFSYGRTPLEGEDLDMAKQVRLQGIRLRQPACLGAVF